MLYLGGQRGYIKSCFKTLDITSEGLGEMFDGDSANTLTGIFPLVSMGGRAEGQACADLVAFLIPMFKTPEGVVVGFRKF